MKEKPGETRAEPTPDERAEILLVDDHPIIRQGLAQIIAQDPQLHVCGESEDEAGAWEFVVKHKPDLVVVDIMLRSGSGIELIKRIGHDYPHIGVLVLSMYDESHYVERALKAGAWGYLTKRDAPDKFLTAIHKLLADGVYLSEHLSPALLKRLLSGAPRKGDSPVDRLTDRELQVFQMIGAGNASQEIAGKLHLSVKTIETYQAHIKEKLDLKDSRKLTHYAIRWVLSQSPI